MAQARTAAFLFRELPSFLARCDDSSGGDAGAVQIVVEKFRGKIGRAATPENGRAVNCTISIVGIKRR
jgi:hypothetical protein